MRSWGLPCPTELNGIVYGAAANITGGGSTSAFYLNGLTAGEGASSSCPKAPCAPGLCTVQWSTPSTGLVLSGVAFGSPGQGELAPRARVQRVSHAASAACSRRGKGSVLALITHPERSSVDGRLCCTGVGGDRR